MKPLNASAAPSAKDEAKTEAKEENAAKEAEKPAIDFSKVQIEPLFADYVDFDTFSKSDFRVVKVKACEAVKKSKKLLKFVLDDGTGTDRVILSGDSCGMLISAVHHEDGQEKLNLLMVDDRIPAGAKLY